MQIFVRFFAQSQIAVWSVEWGYRAEPVDSREEESGDIQGCIYGKSADRMVGPRSGLRIARLLTQLFGISDYLTTFLPLMMRRPLATSGFTGIPWRL